MFKKTVSISVISILAWTAPGTGFYRAWASAKPIKISVSVHPAASSAFHPAPKIISRSDSSWILPAPEALRFPKVDKASSDSSLKFPAVQSLASMGESSENLASRMDRISEVGASQEAEQVFEPVSFNRGLAGEGLVEAGIGPADAPPIKFSVRRQAVDPTPHFSGKGSSSKGFALVEFTGLMAAVPVVGAAFLAEPVTLGIAALVVSAVSGGILFARDAIRRAREPKDPEAQYQLGMKYRTWGDRNGGGTQEEFSNYSKALKWFLKAAEQGHLEAQKQLGKMHAQGRGVERNPSLAAEWYRKAAEQGSAEVQYDFGIYLLDKFSDERQKRAEALDWIQRSAGQGYAEAQFRLGIFYSGGQNVPKNDKLAARWYLKAARQNIGGAQSQLGALYLEGKGVPKNVQEAYIWFLLAQAQGINQEKQIAQLESEMPPEQIAILQQRAVRLRKSLERLAAQKLWRGTVRRQEEYFGIVGRQKGSAFGVFIPFSHVQMVKEISLSEGDTVEFEVEQRPEGLTAFNIRKVATKKPKNPSSGGFALPEMLAASALILAGFSSAVLLAAAAFLAVLVFAGAVLSSADRVR